MGRKERKRGEEADRPWTKDELKTLTMSIGAFGIDYVTRNVNRSAPAVYAKIAERFGGGGIGRGTSSLRKVCEDTGYNARQITRAGKALGQRWQRTSTRGRLMLSDDQIEAIVRWLSHDYWCRSSKTYACAGCARTDVPPGGLGLCRNCYAGARRAYQRAGVTFTRVDLLKMLAALQPGAKGAERDWLDAFSASVAGGCVLSGEACHRLLEETQCRSAPP